MKDINTGGWMESRVWENAVIHEMGHALDGILGDARGLPNGISQSDAFKRAWARDYRRIPERLKRYWFPDGKRNYFYYFLDPRNDDRIRARQETFAEAFDVLIRGSASTYNHGDFKRHFPRTLDAIRTILRKSL